MIVPRSRLLVLTALVVLPFATIAGLLPDGMILAVGVIVLFLVLALLDAVLGLRVLDGVTVELPKVTRFSKDRVGQIQLEIRNARQTAKKIRIGFAFPTELHSPHEDMLVELPSTSPMSRVVWPCTPLKRGNYLIDKCYLEGASPFGLWSIRATTPTAGELRVYPNLLTERKSVAALFLNRGNFGAHAQRQVGKGRDFEKLRDYIPGDSYDEVHWKATAKRGRPVTKIFQIERTQEVYVIIDSSRLSAREAKFNPHGKSTEPLLENAVGEHRTSVLERFITAGLVLGLAAEHQGDLFGLLTFSDKVQTFVRAKNGKAHYAACRDALYTLHPQSVTPDFDELCSFIRLRLRRRALLIVLTSLDDPVLAENFVKSMDLISHQHLVLVNMMQPPGARPVFSNPDISYLDQVYEELGGHIRWNNLRELEKVLQRRGVRFSLVPNEKLTAQLVGQYLDVKRRQIL